MEDTRAEHAQRLRAETGDDRAQCYCDECCETAKDWWEWRSEDGAMASGARYWTEWEARLDAQDAADDGLPILTHRSEP
jgi:hypothetical protein